ncbi:MAG: FAD-dependent oxidoreductase, partial [Clostridia bacterium]|nr:FAD-dependent oxidoreductase [Clostridia bacterium]
MTYDVIIIGGGPAGYTAALYGVRAGLSCLVLEKFSAGGQMTQTDKIDNYPGFDEGVDGFTLGYKMQAGAQRFGAQTVQTEVLSADLAASPKVIKTDSGEYTAKTVIIATGADHRHLGITGEEDLIGRGVG